MQLKPRGLNFVLVPEKGNADIAKNTYHVAQFPTLLVAGGDGAPVPFQGKLGYSALLAFLEPHAQPRAKREAPPQEPAPTAKPVEYDQVMEEITDAALWDSKCANKSGLCGIAFLDPLDDETRHAKFVATLQETLKAVYRNVRIMWVDAAKHPAFTAHFKLGGACVAVFFLFCFFSLPKRVLFFALGTRPRRALPLTRCSGGFPNFAIYTPSKKVCTMAWPCAFVSPHSMWLARGSVRGCVCDGGLGGMDRQEGPQRCRHQIAVSGAAHICVNLTECALCVL